MRFQAKLTTQLEDFSVGDAIVELSNDVDTSVLNDIVKSLLVQTGDHDEKTINKTSFDFLIGGKLLRLSAEEHLKLYSEEIDATEILSEKLVEVEYIISLEAPKTQDAKQHEDWVSSVDANDTHIITGSYDNGIRIFTINDRKHVKTIVNAHAKPVTKVKFIRNPNGITANSNELYFISCGHDEVSILRRMDLKTTKVSIVFIYRGHNRSVNCVDVNDNLIATGSFDKTIRLWSSGTDDNEGVDENVDGSVKKGTKKQKTKTSQASISASSRFAIMTLTGHQESITGMRWLDSCNEFKSLATCSMDRSICIWDIEVGQCKRRVQSSKPLLGIDFCPQRNILLSASCDKFARIWDARAPDNSSAKAIYSSHSAWVSAVAFGRSSTEHFISGGYDNVVKLWDLRSTKACLYDLIGHHDKVLDVNWNQPAYILSGSADSSLKIFSTETKL